MEEFDVQLGVNDLTPENFNSVDAIVELIENAQDLMAFTSASFIVLTIASVLLYYIVPKKAQWCILLLASAAFYMAGSVKAFAWVVLVSGMTWVTGLILGRYNAIKPADKAQRPKHTAQKEADRR